jgi:hypothetical protein
MTFDKLTGFIQAPLRKCLFFRRKKIFCIGANKTGTTSVEQVFRSLGLKVGNQAKAELLLHDWARRDFRRIIRYCRWAEAFQDVPFSYPDTFRTVDAAYPGSKFILTVRGSADEWYDSLVRFHTRLIGRNRLPTAEDLRAYGYRYPGFLWEAQKLRYGVDETTLYDRALYTRCYEDHNRAVIEYFKDRPADLLVLNVAAPDAIEKLFDFLGYAYAGQSMPHANASK